MYIMTSPETPAVSTMPTESTETMSLGCVKWFNNKAGYGFVTISSGDHVGEDVFVHHSAIDVSQEQYRYLIQGEYVEFKLCSVSDSGHKWQAGSVHGINGGKLMCETRLVSRETRTTRRTVPDGEQRSQRSANTRETDGQPHYRVRTRGPGPREGEEWMLVRRRPPASRQRNSSPTKEVLRGRQTKAPYHDGD